MSSQCTFSWAPSFQRYGFTAVLAYLSNIFDALSLAFLIILTLPWNEGRNVFFDDG